MRAEAPDGVILARGGQSHGYALYLMGGRPCFGVRLAGGIETACGDTPLGEDWVRLVGMLTGDAVLRLYVNGSLEASHPLPRFIVQDPNEEMQIGMDRATRVGAYGEENGFTGLIDAVRIYSGELGEAQLQGGG